MNDLQSNALEARLKVLSESVDAVTASMNGALTYLDRISNALERIADSAEVWCPGTPQVTTTWSGEPKAIVTPLARRTKMTIQDESRYQNTADSPPSGM